MKEEKIIVNGKLRNITLKVYNVMKESPFMGTGAIVQIEIFQDNLEGRNFGGFAWISGIKRKTLFPTEFEPDPLRVYITQITENQCEIKLEFKESDSTLYEVVKEIKSSFSKK